MRELELKFTNWTIEDVIRELNRHIENGFHIGSYSYTHSLGCNWDTDRTIEVSLYNSK